LVEDSATVRCRLREVLESDSEIDLVAEASDGKRAIELCQALRPDVITMDMMLPVMSGLAATEYIMAYCPTPILIVSASINRGEVFKTYEALAAGAVDVMEKPRGDEPDGSWERKYLQTLKLVSRIRVITHPRGRLKPPETPSRDSTKDSTAPRQRCTLVAIGTSTGGPGALVEILRALPEDFRLPLLVVLHISEPFGTPFADWLDTQSRRRVSYAREGAPLSSATGRVVMAPPGQHLVLRGGHFHLTRDPERHSCRPSVDVLFESIARECGPSSAACLLTGMGHDGAAGLLALRRAGALTIAQDEASCVVYGMPREAVLLNAAQRVLPLADMAPELARLNARSRSGRP